MTAIPTAPSQIQSFCTNSHFLHATAIPPSSPKMCQPDEKAEPHPSKPSICGFAHKMLLCCCWPLHKCVTMLSLLDTVIVLVGAYKSFNLVSDSWPETPWIAWASLFFFAAFSVCQVLATVLLILGHKKQLSHYLWPRLTLLVGLLICASVAVVIMSMYFSGESTRMNSFFFAVYEWFFSEKLDEIEKKELKSELKIYIGAFLALGITFAVYTLFELMLTRKYYNSLKRFQPVATSEPSAPHQQAYNPDYAPNNKMYPHLA